MPKDREVKSIDQIEEELAEDEVETSAPPVKGTKKEDPDSWSGVEREEDADSDRDKDEVTRVYTAFADSDQTIGDTDEPNPTFRKILMDKKKEIEARDTVRCLLLHRKRTREYPLEWEKSKKIAKETPWRKTLGYSFNGTTPAPNKSGGFFSKCVDKETGVPFAICSINHGFEKETQEPKIVPLSDIKGTVGHEIGMSIDACGECPWGRWGNSMTDDDRKRFLIRDDDKPLCNHNVVGYHWDLDLENLFRIFYKRTNLPTVEKFIADCTSGIGEKAVRRPFYSYYGELYVMPAGKSFVVGIKNTKIETPRTEVEPIADWFMREEAKIVKNKAIVMEDLKRKYDEALEFDTKELEGKGK